MAIAFARAAPISRGKAGSAVRTAAYNARTLILSERTGETHDYRDQADSLLHHEVMLPTGAPAEAEDPGVLWNLAAAAEKRKDAVEAREIVLALPNNPEISHADRIQMAREFAEEHFVSKGIAAQLDVHRRQPGAADSDATNPHAHILIGTRRLSAGGFSAHKAVDLEPQLRTGRGGRRLVVEAEAWGESWRQFQDEWFARHAYGIKVDAIAPMPGEHLGPKRLRNPFDPRVQDAAARADANSRAGHAPQRNHRQLLHASRMDRKFGEVGSRPLTARDIAQEQDKAYADLRARARHLNGLITKASKYKAANATHKAAAQARLEARWHQMGLVRKTAHLAGSWGKIEFLRDVRIDQEEKQIKRSEWGFNRWSIRRTQFVHELESVIRQGRAAYEAIRPAAEEELRHRRKTAQDARETMDNAAGYALEQSRGMKP